MRRSNRIDLTQTQTIEIRDCSIGIQPVSFIRHQEHRLFDFTDMRRNSRITHSGTGTGIDHKQHHIRFSNGL